LYKGLLTFVLAIVSSNPRHSYRRYGVVSASGKVRKGRSGVRNALRWWVGLLGRPRLECGAIRALIFNSFNS
jgi:hypothetical protein